MLLWQLSDRRHRNLTASLLWQLSDRRHRNLTASLLLQLSDRSGTGARLRCCCGSSLTGGTGT